MSSIFVTATTKRPAPVRATRRIITERIVTHEDPFALDPRPKGARFPVAALLVASLAILVAAVTRVHIPYVVLAPGPTRDVAKLTTIAANTYSSQGSFHVTTALVKDDDGIPLDVAIKAFLDDDETLLPREAIFPPDSTRKETDLRNAADMSESQLDAAVAALGLLGMEAAKEGAFVQDVSKDSKGRGTILPGDIIVSVEGKPVMARDDLGPAIQAHPIGTVVTMHVVRGDETKTISFPTIESPEAKGRPVLGITVVQNYRLPFDVDIDAGEIGGPSAGLVFALSIYDLLEPSDLTGGRRIAGTGVIRADGTVEAVGAVAQKTKGAIAARASVFVVPKGEVAEAKKAADGTSLQVIGVSSLAEAIQLLRDSR